MVLTYCPLPDSTAPHLSSAASELSPSVVTVQASRGFTYLTQFSQFRQNLRVRLGDEEDFSGVPADRTAPPGFCCMEIT